VRATAESELRAPGRSEQVGDERKVGALDVPEEERGPAGGDDPPMHFRGFQVRVDRGFNRDQVVVARQLFDERAQVGEGHGARWDGWDWWDW
jgi:hypothetical protein